MNRALPLPSILLCGYERGGTTLLSEILRANGYESGFECGVLLADKPSDFVKIEPYFNMLLGGWKISEVTRREAIGGDFRHFYSTLIGAAFPESSASGYFDKTPIYMQHLGKCLSRTDFINKAIVITRDPRSVFVSMAKRLEPGIPVEEAVNKRLNYLVNRYISYFIGSIAHSTSKNVLFVPFEELCSREDAILKTIGFFVEGNVFAKRQKTSIFANVSSNVMDLSRISEFDNYLSPNLQKLILNRTRIASPFFMNVSERISLGDMHAETLNNINKILCNFDLPQTGMIIDGTYFEPMTYLLRYPDILAAKINPVKHFQRSGQNEKRIPY